jgi:membrane-associated phospholipid phosphatase
LGGQQQLWERAEQVRTGVPARVGVCLLTLIYFQVGYKWGYRSHDGAGVIDGLTGLDAMLPLVPGFIVFYMLGYFFVFAPCFVVRERHAFRAAIVAFCVCMAVGFVVFRYFPIEMQKTYATGDDWFSKLAYFQQSKDTAYNNFPSLHVGLNVYAYALIAWQSRKINPAWLVLPVLIIISTLLVKQHLVIDVLGGLVLATGGFLLFRRIERSRSTLCNRLYAVTLGGLWLVLATHLERIRITWQKLERFLAAGSLEIVPVFVGLGLLLAGVFVFRQLRQGRGIPRGN